MGEEPPNFLLHLSKIYHEPNCLEELSEMHKLLVGKEPDWAKRMDRAIAREKIARTGLLGRRRGARGKWKRKVGEMAEEKGGGKRARLEGEEGLGHEAGEGLGHEAGKGLGHEAGEGEEGLGHEAGKGEEVLGREEAGLAPIDLDPDFLKVLEKMAETSGQRREGPEGAGQGDDAAGSREIALAEVREDLKEWRRRFEAVLAMRYARSERIRFLFCSKMYGHYVQRMRQINRMKSELRTCKEKRLLRKFDLDQEERVLLDRGTGRPYLCYEDMFDAIHKCHAQSEVNEMRTLFSQLKEHYANITFECVLEYFKASGKQQPQQGEGELALGGDEEPLAEANARGIAADSERRSPGSEEDGQQRKLGADEGEEEGTAETVRDEGEQLKFSRSKYRTLFGMDAQKGVHCKLCPFVLAASSSSNQTYQKIRNHIRYNHGSSCWKLARSADC